METMQIYRFAAIGHDDPGSTPAPLEKARRWSRAGLTRRCFRRDLLGFKGHSLVRD
jgi:hypothetical protein